MLCPSACSGIDHLARQRAGDMAHLLLLPPPDRSSHGGRRDRRMSAYCDAPPRRPHRRRLPRSGIPSGHAVSACGIATAERSGVRPLQRTLCCALSTNKLCHRQQQRHSVRHALSPCGRAARRWMVAAATACGVRGGRPGQRGWKEREKPKTDGGGNGRAGDGTAGVDPDRRDSENDTWAETLSRGVYLAAAGLILALACCCELLWVESPFAEFPSAVCCSFSSSFFFLKILSQLSAYFCRARWYQNTARERCFTHRQILHSGRIEAGTFV